MKKVTGRVPGVDKATGRVVALIVLLIVVAAALRGYLPAQDHAARAEPGGRAALTFVVTALAGTLALLAIAVVARLRDPRVVAPNVGELSELLGTGRGRPSWRVLLIGLAVIVAWLLMVALVMRIWVPHDVAPSPPTSTPTAPPPGQAPAPRPQSHPQNDNADMFRILLLATVPMLLMLIVGTVIMSARRRRAAVPDAVAEYHPETPTPGSDSLVRAAERGLAEVADLGRDPREAIIACYAAMERELANVPGAVPQEFDTPTEVLARAVEHHALHADNAVQLVQLFAEARFSPHVMNENHRDVAVGVLRLVLDELGSRSAA